MGKRVAKKRAGPRSNRFYPEAARPVTAQHGEAGAPHFVTLSPVRTGIFDRVVSLMVMRKEGKFGVNLPS